MLSISGKILGSPPHLRGKRKLQQMPTVDDRITPAPAGKTFALFAYLSVTWDHPRTCGENLNKSALMYWREGSPPHLRGKHGYNGPYGQAARITPAPAGKTFLLKHEQLFLQDHPRTCGENFDCSQKSKASPGSPPHLRGKRYIYNLPKIAPGITPAPAGKTFDICPLAAAKRDHPRTCGENTKK